MIILDLGNGGIFHNDREAIEKTIDSVAAIDIERTCILKFQLFLRIDGKVQLRRDVFHRAWEYATGLGFNCTSSVFDYDSVDFLSQYEVPFVKISNHPHLKKERVVNSVKKSFIEYSAHGFPLENVIMSVEDSDEYKRFRKRNILLLCCVSEYPATIVDYRMRFTEGELRTGISDHTDGLELYKRYRPKIWEKHYVLDEVTDKPRSYAMRPEGLREVLLWS